MVYIARMPKLSHRTTIARRFRSLCLGALALTALALAALASGSPARAEVATDYQQWAVLNVDANLDAWAPGLRLTLNTESRAANAPRRSAEVNMGVEEQNPNTIFILRPIAGYQIASWLTLGAGYAWQPIFYRSDVREDVMEHRPFWQANGAWTWPHLQLGYRTRLEHRYRTTGDRGDVRQGEDQWAHRVRQQLRLAALPVADGPWQLIAAPELFVHLNETTFPTQAGLDQVRMFVGAGYQMGELLRAEAGYLMQAVRRFTDRDQLNHVLWISLNFKLVAERSPDPSGS
jgi:hypothetical protein